MNQIAMMTLQVQFNHQLKGHSMKVTTTMLPFFSVNKGKVYSSHALPSYQDKRYICWSHNDEYWNVKLNKSTMELTGHYYDWNDEAEDWEDTFPLTDIELLDLVKANKLLAVSLA